MTKREILLDPNLDVRATVNRARSLADRAIKKGLSGGYEISTESRMVMNVEDGQMYEKTFLIVEGSPAKYNGWTFLARVEWTNGQAIVSASPNVAGEQVDRAKLVEGSCDHCGVNRRRNAVIIVENEDGDRKQVGKSCAKDYLGHSSPVAWFGNIEDEFDEFVGYNGLGKCFQEINQAMTAAASVVRQMGYQPGVTKDIVKLFLGAEPVDKDENKFWKELREGFDQEKDFAAAKAAFDFAEGMQGTSDYVQNVQVVISVGFDGYFDPKYMGLVASIAGVYAKELAKNEIADEVVNAEFGKVGDKVNLEIKSVYLNSFDTMYGISYLNVFTSQGYSFKWFTGTTAFEVGETYEIKGTIKSYEEYNGKITTVLTRCKVIG